REHVVHEDVGTLHGAGDERARRALGQRPGDELVSVPHAAEGDEEVPGVQRAGVDGHARGGEVAVHGSAGGGGDFGGGPQRRHHASTSAVTATSSKGWTTPATIWPCS